ncbi:DUF2474 domain-containing protein [Paraburkholderia sp. RL18-103-BIB-C]|uniref:DUF2474 domain-containing protein n=1 Tax=Paraburkholderia sp. RL18-103-BIB-C TaxID=3031637 RepID=UPI0038B73296
MEQTASRDSAETENSPLWKHFAWLFAIWLASVSSVIILAEAIRFLMSAAGLKTH